MLVRGASSRATSASVRAGSPIDVSGTIAGPGGRSVGSKSLYGG